MRKDQEVFTRNRTHLWSFRTHIFRKTFEVMTSTLPIGSLGSVAFQLVETLYQGNHDRNHNLCDIRSTGRYILHYACAAGNLPSLSISRSRSRNIPICIYGILYFKLNGIDAINKITTFTITCIQLKDIYIAERDIKGSSQLLFVFLEKLLYEVSHVHQA